jgi:serine protease Do
MAAIISLSANAQDEGKPKEKHKKAKEIVIRENPEGKGKTTVIIDEDGNVTVNGKAPAEWGGGKITIMPDEQGDENVILLKRAYENDMMAQNMKFKVLTDNFQMMGGGVRLGLYTAENEKGALVTEVMDSSAAFKAGLKKDDIITKVNNSPISNPEVLSKVIREHQPGDVVTVHYLRGDKEEQANVTLEKPREFRFVEDMKPLKLNFRAWPGMRPRLGANIQDTEDSTGVKVLHVNPESPAATAGLQKDDVIRSIDGKEVKSVDDALEILRTSGDKYTYPITVKRGADVKSLQVKIPRDLKSATL